MERYNAYFFSCVASRMQTPGWPDRYMAHKWWSGWLEFKGAATRVAPGQKVVLREIRSRGAAAWVVRLGGVNQIEDEEGNVYAHFDGTGIGLLTALKGLK
jgi:hypothetical protein